MTDQLISIVPPPEVDPAGSGVFWATLAQVLRAPSAPTVDEATLWTVTSATTFLLRRGARWAPP